MFPRKWLREKARATGFVIRERKIRVEAFFWVLILSYGTVMRRTLASLKRGYEKESGQTLSDSSWYDRFTPDQQTRKQTGSSYGMMTVPRLSAVS